MSAVKTPRRPLPRAPRAASHPPPGAKAKGRGLLKRSGLILWRAVTAFSADNVSRLGAALAFYTTIAVAPMFVLVIAVAGMVLDDDTARQRVIGEIERFTGSEAAEALRALEKPTATKTGVIATAMGFATLVFGAFGVFMHMQDALNAIWRVKPQPEQGIWKIVRRRILSAATVMGTGFLLLVSLVVSAVLSWFSTRAFTQIGLPVALLEVANLALSVGVATFLFALIFKLLPDTPVPWRHVWLGAVVTAVLFAAGRTGLAWYLGRTSVTSAYGAAGSLVALLLWCYYAAQIVFFGAEFTRVASMSDGGRNFSPLEEKGENKRG